MGVLAVIPWPIRLIVMMIAGFFIYKLIGLAPIGLLIILAVALWTISITSLLYEAGFLNIFARLPGVSNFLGFVTNRSKLVGASSPQVPGKPAANDPAGELDANERQQLYNVGAAELDALVGVEAAKDAILTRLVETAKLDPSNPFATLAPAVLVLMSGPRGVGKTIAAQSCVRMLAGVGALRTANLVTLLESDFRGGARITVTDLVGGKAKAALGGVLLLDDADWMLSSVSNGQGAGLGVEVGLALLGAAQKYPRGFLLIATMTAEGEERLRRDLGHKRWLDKLMVRHVPFNNLDDGALLTVLNRQLATAGWRFDSDESSRAARRLLASRKEDSLDGFDNAEACRRLAERLIDVASVDGAGIASRVVSKAVVQEVANEVE